MVIITLCAVFLQILALQSLQSYYININCVGAQRGHGTLKYLNCYHVRRSHANGLDRRWNKKLVQFPMDGFTESFRHSYRETAAITRDQTSTCRSRTPLTTRLVLSTRLETFYGARDLNEMRDGMEIIHSYARRRTFPDDCTCKVPYYNIIPRFPLKVYFAVTINENPRTGVTSFRRRFAQSNNNRWYIAHGGAPRVVADCYKTVYHIVLLKYLHQVYITHRETTLFPRRKLE